MKKEIKKYVEEYVSESYPDQQQGEYPGTVDDMVDNLIQFEKMKISEKDLKKEIDEMIENGELIEDSREWVNPENEQQTILIDIIITNNYKEEESDFINIRKNQSSWGHQHPANYITFLKSDFNDFKNELLEELEGIESNYEEDEDCYLPISSDDVVEWKGWDDVSAHDIM